ncbi:MAG: glycosyltransferase family 4 protein [Cytophagales bacterium]|nr:glycosyltransferase family 4 protein [Cytophagales bacterium]
MPKIIFFTFDSYNVINGVNTWLIDFCPFLKAKGYEVTVIAQSYHKSGENLTLNILSQKGIHISLIPNIPYYTDSQAHKCWQYILQYKPDIIINNSILPAFYTFAYAKQYGVQCINITHNHSTYDLSFLDRFISEYPLSKPHHWVAVSKELCNYMMQKYPKYTHFRHIPCGVAAPAQYALPPTHTFKIIYAGRLDDEQKNIITLTHTLCRLVAALPYAYVEMYGNGTHRQQVTDIIYQAKNNNIKYGGQVSPLELKQKISQFHSIIFMSHYEGTPVALMEGMIAGLVPLLGCKTGGIADMVMHEDTGYYFNNFDELVQTVSYLYSTPADWSKISDNAKVFVQKKYSLDAIYKLWEQIFAMREDASIIKTDKFALPAPSTDKTLNDTRRPPLLVRLWKRLIIFLCNNALLMRSK